MTARNSKTSQDFLKLMSFSLRVCGYFVVFFSLWIKVQAQVPAPSGITQVGPFSGQINLVWTPIPGAAAYQVSRALMDMTNTPTPSVVSTVPFSTPGYTDNQVTDGRSYQYLITGVDGSGNLGLTSAIVAIPYTIPGLVNPTVSNSHNNSLDLTWSSPLSTFPILFYNIYRQSPAGQAVSTTISSSQFFALSPTPIATTFSGSFTDSQPSSVNPNFYAVVAVNGQPIPNATPIATQLVPGSFPTVSTGGALPINSLPPVAPSLFGFIPVAGYGTATPGAATATPVYGAELVWNGALANENVTSYQIFSNGNQISTVVVTPTPLATYTYLNTSIVPVAPATGVSVAYSIVANNSNGSVTSNTVLESILASAISGAVTVTPNPTPNAIMLTWNQAVTGTYGLIKSYSIFKGVSGVPVPYATPNPSFTTTPTFTPTPFATILVTPSRTPTLVAFDTTANTSGSDFTYWVQPIDAVGSGGEVASSTQPFNFGPTPATGVNATLVSGSNNKVNVTWSSASPGYYGPVVNYVLYLALSGGTPTAIATVGPAKTSRNSYVANLTGATAVYSLSAIDGFGNASDMSVGSSPVNLNTSLNPPQIPRLIGSAQSGSSLTYNWLLNPTPDAVTHYTVFGSDFVTDTITPTPIAILLPTPAVVNSYTTTAPPLWQVAPYYLVANNASGSSLPATLSAIPVPTYVVTAVVQPTQGVNISWSMAPPPNSTPYVDSVVIYRTLATPTTTPYFSAIATVSVSTPTYLDGNVTPGTRYLYMVTGRSNNLSGTPTPVSESPVSVMGIAYPTVITWPNIPTGVLANTGSSATTLSWSPNPASDGVQSYTIYRNGTATATITPSPTMSVVFAETPGNVSSYQVVANNPGGSIGSSPITVLAIPSMTPTVLLTPPAGYTPVSSPTPMVWISGLTYPVSVQGYTIYRATDSAFVTGIPVATVVAPTPFVSDPGQTGYINYYKAVANNGAGINANFTLSGLVGINLWPNPPSSFVAYTGSAAATLTWTKPLTGSSPITAYAVFKGIAAGAENPTPTVVSSLSSSIDPQVTPGAPYYYYMESISDGLYSLPTNEQAVIAGQAPILNAVAGAGQAILTWSPVIVTASSPITEYLVTRLAFPTPGSTPATFLSSTNLTTTTYTDTGVNFNIGYVYSVAPIGFTSSGATIFGPYSNSVTLTTPPQAPTSVVAVSGDQLVQLRWNFQGSAVTTYTFSIQRKLGTAPVTAYQTIASGLTGLDYTDAGLLDKTLYNYEIVVASQGLTGISQPVNALPAKPPVVDNAALTLTQTQSGNTISWQAANGLPGDFNSATMYPLGGYRVYRSSDGGGTYQLLDAQGDTLTSYTDDVSIINGSNYTYTVYAYDAPPNVNTNDPNMVHESPYNSIFAPSISASTALDRNSLRPFGAPNEQVVDIRFVVTKPGNVQIKVYSLSGTFIKQLVNQHFEVGVYGIGGNYPLQWDGRNAAGNLVASGVYLITTEMNGLQEIDKIAVIK